MRSEDHASGEHLSEPPLLSTLTPAEIRAECERIWQRPGVAYHGHKAGWRLAWDEVKQCGIVLEEGERNYLAPRKGAPMRWNLRLRFPGAYFVRKLWGR